MSVAANGGRPRLREGWEWRKLGEIVQTSSGGTPSRKRSEFYENGSIPWLKIADLTDSVVSSASEEITEAALESCSARRLPEGTLLIAMYGSIGKLGILGMQAATNQAICALETDDRVLRDYLFWYLRGQRDALLGAGYGGTQANISQTFLRALPIPVPPRQEQEAIVELVESKLAAIEEADDRVATALRLTDGYRASCLDAAFLRGSCKWTPLDEVADIQSGIAKGRRDDGAVTEMPYLRTANVQAGFLDLSEVKTLAVTEAQAERYSLKDGDVLVLEGGDADKVGRGWIWNGQVDPCLHQNHVFAVRPNRALLLPRYLAYYVNSPPARRYFLSVAKQTTNLASINKSNLRALPVPVPDSQRQEEIVKKLDEQMEATRKLGATLASQRSHSQHLRRAVIAEATGGQGRGAR